MPVAPVPVLTGRQVLLRPVAGADAGRLRAIRAHPAVHRWWGDAEPAFPGEDDSCLRWAVVVGDRVAGGDRVVGMVQACEEADPDYRHAGIDVFLDPEVHGRGLGRDTVATVARWLVEGRGHHRLVVDPAAANARAIACYAAVGFRRVGVLRRYERDAAGGGFRDGLLMEALAEDLVPEPFAEPAPPGPA
ncbi:MAG: GNAT family protein [Candidatus Nanopelagicales bacterium]